MASRSRKTRTGLSLVLNNRRIMNTSPYCWRGPVASMISEGGQLEEQPLTLLCTLSPSPGESDPRVRIIAALMSIPGRRVFDRVLA
jgi:hypothetical protein